MSSRSVRSLGHLICIVAGIFMLAMSSAAAANQLSNIYRTCNATGCNNFGGTAFGPLFMDAQGNLFGTSSYGGAHTGGIVFELRREATRWKFQVLYNFCWLNDCVDGSGPVGNLIMDTAGNLYGITRNGGTHGDVGTIFELSPVVGKSTWTEKVLYNFCSENSACTDGESPAAGLAYAGQSNSALYDGVSNLYGTTTEGGKSGFGTVYVFKPSHNGWSLNAIYSFCAQTRSTCAGYNGTSGSLVVGSAGTLYGVTGDEQSSSQYGSVFKLSSISGSGKWSFQILHAFCSAANCPDGAFPRGIVMDASGNIFGTTSQGGSGSGCRNSLGCGVIFKISPNGTESLVHTFCEQGNCDRGAEPAAGLAIDVSGNIYGTTEQGGSCSQPSGCGTIFEISSGKYRLLNRLCTGHACDGGAYPTTIVTPNGAGGFFYPANQTWQGASAVFEWTP